MITEPTGVEQALQKAVTDSDKTGNALEQPLSCILQYVSTSGELSKIERLSIYAEGYFARILEVLEQDFCTVANILEKDSFAKLVADYLKKCPSTYTNISSIGKDIPRFVRDYEMTRDYEFLWDLAELEWKIIESFYAKNLEKLEVARLQKISEAEWPNAVFQLDPSVHLIKSNWAVHELWTKRNVPELDDLVTSMDEIENHLIVYRNRNGNVCVESASCEKFSILTKMHEHLSLLEICELFESQTQVPPIMEWFQEWATNGVIQDIQISPIGIS